MGKNELGLSQQHLCWQESLDDRGTLRNMNEIPFRATRWRQSIRNWQTSVRACVFFPACDKKDSLIFHIICSWLISTVKPLMMCLPCVILSCVSRETSWNVQRILQQDRKAAVLYMNLVCSALLRGHPVMLVLELPLMDPSVLFSSPSFDPRLFPPQNVLTCNPHLKHLVCFFLLIYSFVIQFKVKQLPAAFCRL